MVATNKYGNNVLNIRNLYYFFSEKAVVRCVAFEGLTKVHITDDKIFGGPLVRQYQQAMTWLKSKLSVRYKIEGGGPREEIWEIPEIALKETVINALCHRDYYDKGGRIMVEVYDDRVEVTNPGGLVSAIPLAEFGIRSHSRNPLVFGLFERMHLVEQIGSGIGRIRSEMERGGLPVPEFKTEGMFTVVFQRIGNERAESSEKSSEKNWQELRKKIRENKKLKMNKSQWKILELIFSDPNTSIEIMSEAVGITTRAIEKNIDKLKDKGLLIREGSDRGDSWKIAGHDS